MSVLIKGMEMPETCCDCNFNIAGWCAVNLASERIKFPGRPDWCPLVEVPTPHGALIDRDALEPLWEINEDGAAYEYYLPWMIEDAPTIIEAEE